MKQHQKWLNKTIRDESANKFEIETGGMTTIDQIISTISETSWRGAFELMLEWLEIEESFEVFQARIKKELEDGN